MSTCHKSISWLSNCQPWCPLFPSSSLQAASRCWCGSRPRWQTGTTPSQKKVASSALRRMARHEWGVSEIELKIIFKKSSEPGTKKHAITEWIVPSTIYIYDMKTKVKTYECDSVTWSTMFRTRQQSQANTTPLTHHRNHDHNKIQQANQRIKTLRPIPTVTCCVLQRSRVGESLTLVFGQLHLVRGEGPAAVRITVHLNNGWLQAEVVAHLRRGIWLTSANQTTRIISYDSDWTRLELLVSNMQIRRNLKMTLHRPSLAIVVRAWVQYCLTTWYVSKCQVYMIKTSISMANQGRVSPTAELSAKLIEFVKLVPACPAFLTR